MLTLRNLCIKLADVLEEKDEYYGSSTHDTYMKYGFVSYLTRMSDKFNRLNSIYFNDKLEAADETMYDTLMDLAGYAILAAKELKESQK